MKRKLFACLMVCVIALSLVSPLAAADAVQPRAVICPRCQIGTISAVVVTTAPGASYETSCIHGYRFGNDLMRVTEITYQDRCSYCSLVSSTYVQNVESRECHGYN